LCITTFPAGVYPRENGDGNYEKSKTGLFTGPSGMKAGKNKVVFINKYVKKVLST